MDEKYLTKFVFNFDYAKNGRWCKAIKRILSDIHMVDHYNGKLECDLYYCIQIMLSNFANRWKRDIQKKLKL